MTKVTFDLFSSCKLVVVLCYILLASTMSFSDDEWKITAYCPAKCCCGKWADGTMASGTKCKVGYVACNILPFNTSVEIEGLGIFVVKDRGAKRYFDRQHHIDIYFDNHEQAKQFGVQYRKVKVTE